MSVSEPGWNTRPNLQSIVADLEMFVRKGAGFWRGFNFQFQALPALRVVSDREASDGGPDAYNDAVEGVLEGAILALENPSRAAALHLFGFSDEGRKEIGKTKRGDLAAEAIYTNGRSFRRKGKDLKTKESHLIEAVAESLLKLESEGGVGEKKPRLLYVEDTERWTTVAKEALPDYEVICAESLGKAMFALVNEGPFALVLVDPNLTDLDEGDGLEVLEYLRDRMPEVPRVVVTGSRFPGAITKTLGKRYGVSEILIKGDYTLPDLRSTIDSLVNESISNKEGSDGY